MAKMKAVQVPRAGADFELVEREIPEPGSGHVRIHVQACGICHSDVITKEGLFPGMSYPRVPGRSVMLTIALYHSLSGLASGQQIRVDCPRQRLSPHLSPPAKCAKWHF